jgi:lipopolysaccharide export system protein LptA
MLRSTRALLLLAILAILGAVGASYYRQRRSLARDAPAAPKSLPLNTDAAATDWVWVKDQGNHRIVEVRARQFRQLNDKGRVEIEGVELKLNKEDQKEHDLVRSAKAEFDQARGLLYSDGEVEITLGIPDEGPPRGRLLGIRTSGVTFEAKTGKATTDRPATFQFDQGDGSAVGATYDPNLAELIMKSKAELHWRPPNRPPMTIEAAELIYREHDSVVLLNNSARMKRNNTVLDTGSAVVTLKDNAIEKVEAQQATGTDSYPNRKLEYAADKLFMAFAETGEVNQIIGDGHARLVSTSDTGRTNTTADRVEMSFDVSSGESQLTQALLRGKCVMESEPAARPGGVRPENRVLRSETVVIRMRPGGREVAVAQTQAPGRLEFLPNSPGQRHRTLDADRMNVAYGNGNRIESFTASEAATRTDPDPRRGPGTFPVETWSQNLAAGFDPSTGQLARLEQWSRFRYQEGERRATAEHATLDEAAGRITLDRSARAWDSTGATSADRIVLDQKTGDVAAQGNVVSTRMPDRKGESSAMLSHDEPLQARADRMDTAGHNQKIHYEGGAIVWQGANRIWGDTVDIDRSARRLTARGNVKTQFVERQQPEPGKPAPTVAPVVVVVTAAAMAYTEEDRLVRYTGGAHLIRPGLDVKAPQIRAWLNGSDSDSSLNRAFGDGGVQIVRTEGERIVRTASDHAEYYTAEQKIFLSGGEPTITDSIRGSTRGRELTYYAQNDKLLVNGAEKDPVKTMIHRR